MVVSEKIFKLVLKTVYKKVFPKYQVNANFLSFFMPPGMDFNFSYHFTQKPAITRAKMAVSEKN